MDDLPTDIQNIIYDYKSQLEHVERMKDVLSEIPFFFHTLKQSRLNLEFSSIYFPNFLRDLFSDSLRPWRIINHTDDEVDQQLIHIPNLIPHNH